MRRCHECGRFVGKHSAGYAPFTTAYEPPEPRYLCRQHGKDVLQRVAWHKWEARGVGDGGAAVAVG